MGYRPRKPVGTSQFMLFSIAVWDYLFGGKFPFIDTDTVKWDRGPNGYAARAAQPAAGGGGSSPTLQITGEWDPGRTYKTQEVAIISMGSNAGTYVYINQAASSGNAPYAGGGWWMQLPGNPMGVWM